MQKYLWLLILIGFLLSLVYYYKASAQKQTILVNDYRLKNELLLTNIRKLHDEKIKLEQENHNLSNEAKKDRGYFNWNMDISNTHVIRRLREN